jgi:type IV pilus assembly protein PilW
MSVDNLKQAMQPNAELIMPVNKFLRQHQGFTLIEIMVSMLLGIFLLGGVMGIFLNTKQTYRVQDALGRLQENGRYAMEFLGKDIRMADYKACATDSFTPGSPPIEAVNNNAVGDGIDNGTDEITVRWIPTCGAAPVGSAYDIRSANLARNTAPLIEGVQDMQIKYGVDDPIVDGVPDYYADYSAGIESKVVAIRVSLLLRTIEDNIAANPLPYTFNGVQNNAPGDRRIRRVFSSTYALRNRIH